MKEKIKEKIKKYKENVSVIDIISVISDIMWDYLIIFGNFGCIKLIQQAIEGKRYIIALLVCLVTFLYIACKAYKKNVYKILDCTEPSQTVKS